jgi:3-deoxy-7-phosphoheptulonate synthase
MLGMLSSTDDVRIRSLKPLLPPAILMEELPLNPEMEQFVAQTRTTIETVLHGGDERLLVIVGPCSIHDTKAALEYAEQLKEQAARFSDDLCIVMRTYFEKPRTRVGWKGLINDPHLNNSFAINHGLRLARGFLRDVVRLGVPTGTEFLDPISPQFVADVVSWAAIGARTTESQVHRELASGLSMSVGFKNGTGGNVQIAMDAIQSSSHAHRFLSVTKQGLAAIVETSGNPNCHLILRGGETGPNYHQSAIDEFVNALQKRGILPRLMVDCSHSNSNKDHRQQPAVAANLADQIRSGSPNIFGVMLESFLVEGRQDVVPGKELTYGQSITDACMNFTTTCQVLEQLAQASKKRIQRAKTTQVSAAQ